MLHSFTRNHSDLSTDAGFQFEFFCDCCGNGFKSTFVPSTTYDTRKRTERVGRLASTIGGFLGGWLMSLIGIQKAGLLWEIIVAVIGAIVLLWIISLFKKK